MADDNAKALKKRGDALFDGRENVTSLWQEIGNNFYPERAEFTTERLATQVGFADHLFATDPVLMRRDLGNAFSSMLRPRGREWFKLDVEHEPLKEAPGVAQWLDWASGVMRRAIYDRKSRFVRATKEADHDFAAFGNAVISVEADLVSATLRYRNYHLKDCAWAENAEGVVDYMARDIAMSARQMKQAFRLPRDKLHESVGKACEKEPGKEFKVRHYLMPAADYEYLESTTRKPKAPFVSVYVDCTNERVIREAPAQEFSYVVPRWATLSGSPYAVSPAAIAALPDARMMQALARIIQEAGEKSIDPPMVAAEDQVRGEINLFAGGVTWIDHEYDQRTGAALEPLNLGKDAGLGLHLFDRIQLVLQNAWYLSKLNLPQQGAKTAFETAQLVEEFIRGAVPLFEPAETEYNLPLLDLTAQILVRVGAFGQPEQWPQAIRGRELTFSFSNPLQDAVEKAKVLQFQTVMGIYGAAAGFDPAVMGDLDVRAAARDATRGSGAPADWLREQEAADEEADGIKQKMAVAEGIAQVGAGGQAGEAVGKAVQALSPPPQQRKKAA